MQQNPPDVVCYLRKGDRNIFLGRGKGYGIEAAAFIGLGYDVVGLHRDGREFVSDSSFLKTIANIADIEDGVYFCSERQYDIRKNSRKAFASQLPTSSCACADKL